MKLVDVYEEPEAVSILYELLAERPKENWISHEKMPSVSEHMDFIASRPFRLWLLIKDEDYVGMIECTDRNEIGVHVLKRHQRKRYAARALNIFMFRYQPLPPIPAIRNGSWVANVAVKNEVSKSFFRKMGFRPIQETFVLQQSACGVLTIKSPWHDA